MGGHGPAVGSAGALPIPRSFVQDLPPPGGFVKPPNFPASGFRKISPTRGPAGYLAVVGAVGACPPSPQPIRAPTLPLTARRAPRTPPPSQR